MNENNRELNYS